MLKQFLDVREEIIEASEHTDACFYVNYSPTFAARANRHLRQLKEIDTVTKSLQVRGRTLAECKIDIDTLVHAVGEEKSKAGFNLFGCRLGTKYICAASKLNTAPTFERAVTKMQEDLVHQLSEEERESVRELEHNQGTSEKSYCANKNSMEQRLAKPRKMRNNSEYMDLRFFLGSSAEVERVFSTGKLLISQNRKAMSP